MQLQPGLLILNGKYRIERLLGEGASAQVYLATQINLAGLRALKILRKDAPDVDTTKISDYRSRFELEGRLQEQFSSNPRIVRVHDTYDYDGAPFLVMEFMAGGSVRAEIDRAGGRPLAWQRCAQLLSDTAEGLAALHARRYVHRDVKPSNVLLDGQGRAKVGDLGVAQTDLTRTRTDTRAFEHPGTPGYASPEHANGSVYLTPAADLYALGVMGFEMLTGRLVPPVTADRPAEAIEGDAPEWLRGLIQRMLAFDHRERLPDGAAVVALIAREMQAEREREGQRITKVRELRVRIERALGAPGLSAEAYNETLGWSDELLRLAPTDPDVLALVLRLIGMVRPPPTRPTGPAEVPSPPTTTAPVDRLARMRQEAELREDLEAAQAERRWDDIARIAGALLELVPDDVEVTQAAKAAVKEQVKREREVKAARAVLRKVLRARTWDKVAPAAQTLLALVPGDAEATQAQLELKAEVERQDGVDREAENQTQKNAKLQQEQQDLEFRMNEAVNRDRERKTQQALDERFARVFRRISPDRVGLLLTPKLEIEFVRIPAGAFVMGSDKSSDNQALDDETPQHVLELPEYWIAKTPVTVVQYAFFAKSVPRYGLDRGEKYGKSDHPISGVSWDQCIAFCSWLGGISGLRIELPSEAEWEKAARGVDGRIYPWGNDMPDDERCNFGDNEKGTTPVFKYGARGASPFGLDDAAGNVLEWTRSLWGSEARRVDFPYPYSNRMNEREDTNAARDIFRVLRGGSFRSSAQGARCAHRSVHAPNDRTNLGGVGFRVVMRLPDR